MNTFNDRENAFENKYAHDEQMKFKAEEKELALSFSVDKKTPTWLKGDYFRLKQVFINLIGNAVKFTDSGEVFVEVTGSVSSANPNSMDLRFSVKDTGIGIPAEKCAQVIEKVSQVDESAGRKQEGTGMGLDMVKKIVQRHRASIRMQSQPGRTVFIVKFLI